MSNAEIARIVEPLTAFGRVDVSEDTPKIQFHSIYGIPNTVETFTQLGGTVGTDERGFFCSTGTTNTAFAVIRSMNSIIYKPGEGASAKFSVIYDTPVADSNQRAGPFSVTDAVQFSYEGTEFGIFYQHGGAVEIQTLTFTTSAGGNEDATITIDGTGYTVPLTAGTVQHNAFEATISLNSQVLGWSFSQNDADVIAIAQIDIDKVGAFTFSSATAIAAWTETQVGKVSEKLPTIPQADWDNPPDFAFDPKLRNVYRVQYQYLGYGDIKFFIAVPGSNEEVFQLVHTIVNLNTAGDLNFSNPSMNIGWLVSSLGSTTDVTIHGGSAGYFVQGKSVILTDGRIAESLKTIGSAAETNLITIRNRQVFGDTQSKAELKPISISITHENNKSLSVKFTRNATLSGETNYQYVDKPFSIAEFDTTGDTVSGGERVGSLKVGLSGDSGLVPITDTIKVALAPTETLTISGVFQSGAGGLVDTTINFLQDV